MRKIIFTLSLCFICAKTINAQEAIRENDPTVLKKLEWWNDIKFGLMMHWGTYSQWGIVESWSICPEDEGWTQRTGPYKDNYFEYKKQYEGLIKTFNPTKFDPSKWAKAAKEAGMKYVVMTSKHHDGFCMFDTKQTDYKITSPNCAFSTDPRANILKETFNAFRKEGLGIGAYFSKPDWHNENYWDPYFPPYDRNVNYDPAKYPEKWKQFQDFTYKQIEELTTDYGKIDILWLDGGWVRPANSLTEETKPWIGKHQWVQDVNMPKIAAMARTHQPGLIVVDRSVHGKYENYQTPEQQVPDKPLNYYWETCMTMGDSWSYTPNDKYKSVNKLIHLLVDIVSKGGNFLLNVGPNPDGEFPPVVYQRLTGIGQWMKVNSEAIYETKPYAPYKTGKVCYTQKKEGTVYAIYLADENELIGSEIRFAAPTKVKAISLLGTKVKLKWRKEGNELVVQVPEGTNKIILPQGGWVFKVQG